MSLFLVDDSKMASTVTIRTICNFLTRVFAKIHYLLSIFFLYKVPFIDKINEHSSYYEHSHTAEFSIRLRLILY